MHAAPATSPTIGEVASTTGPPTTAPPSEATMPVVVETELATRYLG
jgi:hypothetical protein